MRATIEVQTTRLADFIRISAKRGRSEDEIIAWGRAPDYTRIIPVLEDSGHVYHSKHMFTGIRYYWRGRQ